MQCVILQNRPPKAEAWLSWHPTLLFFGFSNEETSTQRCGEGNCCQIRFFLVPHFTFQTPWGGPASNLIKPTLNGVKDTITTREISLSLIRLRVTFRRRKIGQFSCKWKGSYLTAGCAQRYHIDRFDLMISDSSRHQDVMRSCFPGINSKSYQVLMWK